MNKKCPETLSEVLGRMDKKKKFRGKRKGRNVKDVAITNELFVSNIPYEASEVELRKELQNFAYPIVDLKIIKEPRTGRGKGFGFITVERKEDALSLLQPTGIGPSLRGRWLGIDPNKKPRGHVVTNIPRPWDEDYVKISSDNSDYDLEPVDGSLPCIHRLNDDVMLNIFSFLEFEELIRLEIVCRRWQNLVSTSVKKLFESNDKKYMELVKVPIDRFRSNRTTQSYIMAKLFQIVGPFIDSLEIGTLWSYNKERMNALVIKYCFNVEHLRFRVGFPEDSEVHLLLQKFPNVSAVHICEICFQYQSDCLIPSVLNTKQWTLTELLFCAVDAFEGGYLKDAPLSLKRLEVLQCSQFDITSVNYIYERCSLLESLIIDEDISSIMTSDIEKLPALSEIGFRNGTECSQHLEIFKKISTLHILNAIDNREPFNHYFEVFPNVTNLFLSRSVLYGDIELDFSTFKGVKKISLPYMLGGREISYSTGSLAQCSHLAVVSICLQFDDHLSDYVKEIIENCHTLKEIILIGFTFDQRTVNGLVDAMVSGKRPRTASKIKLTYNLEGYLSYFTEEIKRLTDVGYLLHIKSERTLYKDTGARGAYNVLAIDPDDFISLGAAEIADLDDLDDIGGDDVFDLLMLANHYGMESLHWEDQKELMYSGYGGLYGSDQSDYEDDDYYY